MSESEMKKAICEKVEKMETSIELRSVLDLIDQFEEIKRKNLEIDSIFIAAKKKYGPVLKKLAE